jgi:hypothetical protein
MRPRVDPIEKFIDLHREFLRVTNQKWAISTDGGTISSVSRSLRFKELIVELKAAGIIPSRFCWSVARLELQPSMSRMSATYFTTQSIHGAQ